MQVLVIIAVSGFLSVFLLGFQSRNVNHGNYRMAAITSFGIAQLQTTLWGNLFTNLTWEATIIYGAAGSFGIVASMYTHKRWFLKKNVDSEHIAEGES